jgi:hypothetical protein
MAIKRFDLEYDLKKGAKTATEFSKPPETQSPTETNQRIEIANTLESKVDRTEVISSLLFCWGFAFLVSLFEVVAFIKIITAKTLPISVKDEPQNILLPGSTH